MGGRGEEEHSPTPPTPVPKGDLHQPQSFPEKALWICEEGLLWDPKEATKEWRAVITGGESVGGRRLSSRFFPFLKGRCNSHTTKVAILKCAILWLVVYAVSHATITTISFQNLLINPKIHSYPLAIKLQLLKEKGYFSPSPSKLSHSESPGSKRNCNLTPIQTKPPNQEKEA